MSPESTHHDIQRALEASLADQMRGLLPMQYPSYLVRPGGETQNWHRMQAATFSNSPNSTAYRSESTQTDADRTSANDRFGDIERHLMLPEEQILNPLPMQEKKESVKASKHDEDLSNPSSSLLKPQGQLLLPAIYSSEVPGNLEHRFQSTRMGADKTSINDRIGLYSENLMQEYKVKQNNNDATPMQEKQDVVGASMQGAATAVMSSTKSTIDEYIEQMRRTGIVNLPRLDIASGDTWVYIDAPAQQPDEDHVLYTQILARYANPFQMRSSTLNALGSSFFDKLLGPTAQYNIRRRRKIVNKLPPNIKYVIDLTPSNEGEDAVNFTEALSCTLGVCQWGMSADRWNISTSLVGGCDELTRLCPENQQGPSKETIPWVHGHETTNKTVLEDDTMDSPARNSGLALASESSKVCKGEINFSPKSPAFESKVAYQLPLDYTPIRHRFAIERVLHAIEGQDPKLDSAVKVWSTAAVAEKYGIKQSLLTDYIVRWLRAPPNTYFMEVHPEVTLKIAEGMQCQALCRDVFAILVGEEALASTCAKSHLLPGYSVHQRKQEYVGEHQFDPWLTRIQYASSAFTDRVKARFEDLTSPESTWIEDLPEVRNLTQHTPQFLLEARIYGGLVSTLKQYVRGAIYHVLCSSYSAMPGPVTDTGKGADFFSQRLFRTTWHLLSYKERCFTRSFWEILVRFHFRNGHNNIDIDSFGNYHINSATTEEEESLRKAGTFQRITKGELKVKIGTLWNAISSNPADNRGSRGSSRINLDSAVQKNKGLAHGPLNSPEPPLASFPHRPKPVGPIANLDHAIWAHNDFSERSPFQFQVTNTGIIQNVQSEPSKRAEESLAFFLKSCDKNPMQLSSRLENHFKSIAAGDLCYNDCWPFFSLSDFFRQAEDYIHNFARQMLAGPEDGTLDLALTDTLVCLQESEMKFLPLWAGGNDDGSSGVFNDDVPIAEGGFVTAGPKVRTGLASSSGSSDFDSLGDDSTLHTSTIVNDGFSDALDRRRVYDDDSVSSAVMATKTLPADDGTAASESTWDHVATPAGTDAMSLADTDEGGAPKVDKGKGRMVEDMAMSGTGDALDNSAAMEVAKPVEEESYDNIFIDDDDAGSDVALSDGDEYEMEEDSDFSSEGDLVEEEEVQKAD
ncbi:hypothetical protein MMC13_001037 [Lambiella insularis]|nr:hypothetical protein [Lambiella insularis]